MSKILSIDKKFVYIDNDGKFLEVKIDELDFTPVVGANVIIHRNNKGQVKNVELVGSSKKRTRKERKSIEVKRVSPAGIYVEELADDDYEDLEVVIETIVDDVSSAAYKEKKHGNRVIEKIIGIFTLLLLGGLLGVLISSVSNFSNELQKIAVFGGIVLFGVVFVLLALFLPRKGRYIFNTLMILAYLLLLGLGVGFFIFDNALSATINLLPFLRPIQSFINGHAFLKDNYPFYIMGIAALPSILGIVYFLKRCSYLKK